MNKEKQLFTINYSPDNQPYEYLGSDGLPISESYSLYLKKCNQFKSKAKKYEQDNLYLKNSHLHHQKYGYESSEQLEEEVLCEREEQKAEYKKRFDIFLSNEDENSTYECCIGQDKRIRILREINRDRNAEFSEDFEKKKMCWFTRYCAMARFIQAARMIIILNRLKKNLMILKTLTPKMIRHLENEMARERGESVESISDSEDKSESLSLHEIYPCGCASKGKKTLN